MVVDNLAANVSSPHLIWVVLIHVIKNKGYQLPIYDIHLKYVKLLFPLRWGSLVTLDYQFWNFSLQVAAVEIWSWRYQCFP